MSTDARRDGRAARRFSRRLLGSIGVLAVIAAALAAVSVLQGPRMTGAHVDAAATTRLAGQTLRLDANQPIAAVAAKGLRISPAVPAKLTVSGSSITVAFDEPLDYDRTYDVTVPGVTGRFQGTPATFRYSFTTPGTELYTLSRRSATGRADAVMRVGLDHSDQPRAVYVAPRIQEFAHIGDTIIAVTIEDDGSNALVVQREGKVPERIEPPATGAIHGLLASAGEPVIGFQLTTPAQGGAAPEYENALFTVDLSGATPGEPRLVSALDGSPMTVSDWTFVPGASSLVVQDYDQSLFLVDPSGRAPLAPLGRHSELRGFLPGTQTLVVADPEQGSTIDLTSGTLTALDLPATDLGDGRYPGKTVVLGPHDYLIALTSVALIGNNTSIDSLIAHVTAEHSTEVFTQPTDGSRYQSYCVSPNGRYLAVETVAPGGMPDAYPGRPGYTRTSTAVIRLDDHSTLTTVEGAFADWCGRAAFGS